MYTLKMALRNIGKNRRRSLATGLSVVLGFAALNLVGGVIENAYLNMQNQAVMGERLAHLTVVKKGLFAEGKLDPAKYLFAEAELGKAKAALEADPSVKLVTPWFGVRGMISNGKVSTIFLGEGHVPDDEVKIRGNFRGERGGRLNAAEPNGVAVAEDLAKLLGLEKGSTAVLFTTTAEDNANAIDVTVIDIFNTGNPATNDKMVLLPFELTRSLYDTRGAERLVVLLDDVKSTEPARERLAAGLNAAGLDVEVKTWSELSLFYNKVKRMFTVIFRLITIIVLIVVILGVMNTMASTVLERTKETGTLRALGMKRWQVVRMFAAEGACLAGVACLVGLPLTLGGMLGINSAGLSFIPPVSSDPVPILVALEASGVVRTVVLFALLGAIAAVLPAFGASRRTIVDALGHV